MLLLITLAIAQASQPASAPAEDQSFETVVTGARQRKRSDEHKLTKENVAHVPGSFGDPIRHVQTLPGVAMLPLLNGQLIVRGTRAGDTAFFIDGMPVPYVFHFGSGFGPSVLPSLFVESLTFTPSLAGTRYGGMLGGVIELKTRDRFEKLVHGYVSLDLLSALAHVYVAPTETLAFEASVRRSYLEVIASPLAKAAPDTIPAIIPYFTDYQAHAAALLGPHTLDLWFYGSDDGFTLVGGDAFAEQTQQIKSALSKTAFNAWKPRWRFKSKTVDHELSALLTYTTTVAETQRRQWQLGVRDEIVIRPFDRISLRAGIDALSTWLTIGPANNGSLLDHVNEAQHRFAAYADLDAGVSIVDVHAGVRLSVWSMGLSLPPRTTTVPLSIALPAPTVAQALEPRGTIGVRVHDTLRLSLGSGLYTAPLAMAAWLPALGPSLRVTTETTNTLFDTVNLAYDPSVLTRFEQSWQSVLSASWQPIPWLTIEVNGFFNLMRDVSPGRVLGAPSVTELRDRIGRRAFGVELFVRTPSVRGFSGWLSYTLSKTDDLRGSRAVPSDYSQTHVLALSLSYAAPYGINLGARFRLGSGWPVTPIVASRFVVKADEYAGEVGARNSGTTPPVHQLDLRIDKTFRFQRWSLTTYIEVMNVYAQKNPEYDYLAWDFSAVRYISVIPVVPMIGVAAEF